MTLELLLLFLSGWILILCGLGFIADAIARSPRCLYCRRFVFFWMTQGWRVGRDETQRWHAACYAPRRHAAPQRRAVSR